MESRDLNAVIREAVFLQEVAQPNIQFRLDLPDTPVLAQIDHRLVTQALTNIVKNATESIETIERVDGEVGTISVSVTRRGGDAVVEVEDNGKGLPSEDRDRLLEPYITTREKGTGLGLAIVRKIMEEHGGSIALLDARSPAAAGRGALVRLTFPAPVPDEIATAAIAAS